MPLWHPMGQEGEETMSRQEDPTVSEAATRRTDWTPYLLGQAPEPGRARADVTPAPLRPCRMEGRLYE